MSVTPEKIREPPAAEHVLSDARDDVGPSHFWRHFLEMFAVMVIGMIASAAIFLIFVQMTWEEALVQRPTASLLVIAAGMSVPMMVWMLYRGMGWRNSVEMAAVMVLPVIPFLCFVWFGVAESALCGPYCIVTIIGMLGLMLYRHSQYATGMGHT